MLTQLSRVAASGSGSHFAVSFDSHKKNPQGSIQNVSVPHYIALRFLNRTYIIFFKDRLEALINLPHGLLLHSKKRQPEGKKCIKSTSLKKVKYACKWLQLHELTAIGGEILSANL